MCEHGGQRGEESAENDSFGDENVADESSNHPGGSFWIYAHPSASKKAAEVLTAIQTIVEQMNSEFRGDDTRKIRLGTVNRLHGDSAWEISGIKARKWARTKGFKVTSTAREIRQTIHVLRCMLAFPREW